MWVEQLDENINIEENEKEEFEKLREIINKYKDQEGTLIKILHEAQNIFGYLPRKVQIFIARTMGIPLPEVYGVVSFYSLFTMEPRGQYTIEICMGTACYVKGSEEILNKLKNVLDIEPGEVTEDGKFTIETTHCLGACSLAPVVSINGDVQGKVAPENVEDILNEYAEV
ncbi:MAG: NAD(P)H-dependent oxidoreductase subunit E [Halanaerobiaceae bacterium]